MHAQTTFTYPRSTKEALEKGVKYVQISVKTSEGRYFYC